MEKAESQTNSGDTGRVAGFIDLGTNSARLLLARIFPDRTYQTLARRKEWVRLGEGEFLSGKLQPQAMERAILVCRRFAEMARAAGADEIYAVATSAARDARNQAEFLQRLAAEDALDLRVISGKEEARLIYLGVASGVNMVGKQGLFVDIGGGSTEIIVGNQRRYHFLDSLDLGAIRMTMLYLGGDTGPITKRRYTELQDTIWDTAVRAIQKAQQYRIDLAIGSSGTIENLAEIASYAARGRRRAVEDTLGLDELEQVVRMLCSLSLDERRKVPGINPERADIIIAGAAILHTLMEGLNLEEIRISERGLQDGMLMDHLERLSGIPLEIPGQVALAEELNLRLGSVLRLGRSLRFDDEHARHVACLALQLFDSARQLGLHRWGDWERELLEYAGLLHDIGVSLSYNDHHRHSYYFIRNADLLGFDQTEIAIIATTTLYHRKANPRASAPEFGALNPRAQEIVRALCILLGIAEGLDRTHVRLVQKVAFRQTGRDMVELQVYTTHPAHLELWGAELHQRVFKRIFGKQLRVSAVTIWHPDA